jgi:pyridoxal phosphate enzyme (YggS family)
MTSPRRRDEIAAGLRTVREQIVAAAEAAGRDPAGVTLVVVTKTFPTSDIRLLVDLGVRDVAENRHQDAAEKAAELSDLELVWHFVGQVQSNKAARIASYADVVHSVDSVRIAGRLGAGAVQAGRTVTALVQVSLDPAAESEGRGGAPPGDVPSLARAVATTEGLRLGGVMAVAPLDEPASDAFARVAGIAAEIRHDHPSATMVSAGMSADFAEAVKAGATHVRVGSAILGSRPPLR